MEVTAILVGGGGRKSARRHERAVWEAERDREIALATHAQNLKLNAALKRDGAAGRFVCGPKCEICFPPAVLARADVGLDVLDLRGGAGKAPRIVLSGKRGRCRRCNERCPRACWYCSDACRFDLVRKPPPRLCACGCREPLPDGAPDAKRYLDPTHQKRAARARQRARR